MEGIVFLIIISMVVRSLYKNSKEAQKKEEARQARGEAPPPKPRSTAGFPGNLSEWIEMLEGKQPARREVPAAPRVEPAPTQADAPASQSDSRQTFDRQQGESTMPLWQSSAMPQRISEEGCQTSPLDCEAPHSALRSLRIASQEPTQEQASPFVFLEGMPEVMKGVVYAEILTRPQQRRRLRP